MNSTGNAFTNYCAYRDQGLNADQSWEALGVYGGDDGLSFDADQLVWEKTAKMLGLSLKIDSLRRGDPIPFLGRIWYGMWTGYTTSTADFQRQLSKLHLTASTTMELSEVMLAKARGLWSSDWETPILGDWARAVFRILKIDPETVPLDPQMTSWFAREGRLLQPERDVAMKAFLNQKVCTEDSVEGLITTIEAAQSLEELFPLRTVVKVETPIKVEALVDGQRHVPASPQPKVQAVKTQKPRQRKRGAGKKTGVPEEKVTDLK